MAVENNCSVKADNLIFFSFTLSFDRITINYAIVFWA